MPTDAARPLLPTLTAAVAILTACNGPADERSSPGNAGDEEVVRLETVAGGLEVPWDLAFAPDGRIFVTERPGRIRVIDRNGLAPDPWATLDVAATGEAGLMGIAVSPDFAENGHVYVMATFRGTDGLEDRIVRFTERGGRGVSPATLVDGLPAARFHAGGALDFGPDGMLYATTGDARDPGAAQRRDVLAGKVLRYHPDGTIPADNPFRDSPVWALGLRNPQGLTWDAETGAMFATDHGPSGLPNERFRRHRDELNAIRPGGNYGWPEVAGMDDDERFIPPLVEWTPAIAPAGLAIARDEALPWTGDLLVGALRGEQIRRVIVEPAPDAPAGWRATGQQALFEQDLGRIRAVVTGPGDRTYFTTSNRDGRGDPGADDDRVIRILPGAGPADQRRTSTTRRGGASSSNTR